MPGGPNPGLDWRDDASYRPLLDVDPSLIAWEWLRRRADYRGAAQRRFAAPCRDVPHVIAADPAAAPWGLHAFEDPALGAPAARPVWRAALLPGVLRARARDEGPDEDRFDLRRYACLAVVARGCAGAEHVLLQEAGETLRIDLVDGSLLEGPVRLHYDLAGIGNAAAPLAALERLLRLCRTARLQSTRERHRNRRLIQLLRACDGLRAGATQRELAAVLLSRESAEPRWRSEVPSLRSRAQRLARGAAAMAGGGYLDLLVA